jgi:TIR domain
MSGVFLSYAREDLPFVRRLRDALSTAGRDPAWDQDHAVVPFSSPYESEITAAIAGSEKFIFRDLARFGGLRPVRIRNRGRGRIE